MEGPKGFVGDVGSKGIKVINRLIDIIMAVAIIYTQLVFFLSIFM